MARTEFKKLPRGEALLKKHYRLIKKGSAQDNNFDENSADFGDSGGFENSAVFEEQVSFIHDESIPLQPIETNEEESRRVSSRIKEKNRKYIYVFIFYIIFY